MSIKRILGPGDKYDNSLVGYLNKADAGNFLLSKDKNGLFTIDKVEVVAETQKASDLVSMPSAKPQPKQVPEKTTPKKKKW